MALSAAIILAAGEGTRMRSSKPKVLHEFAGKTFLQRVMTSVGHLEPETLAVVVHYQADRVSEAERTLSDVNLMEFFYPFDIFSRFLRIKRKDIN